MLDLLLESVIPCGRGEGGRNDVDPDSALGEVIQGCEPPGNSERILVCDTLSDAESKILGGGRGGRHEEGRVRDAELGARLDGAVGVPTVNLKQE